MAETVTAPSGSFGAFLAMDKEDRKKLLARRHALHVEYSPHWAVFLDAYEGSGGFLDGEYLWKYPREETNDYTNRQTQARYHNYAKSLVNLYVRHVLHRDVDRKSEDERLTQWWSDVDGAGTKMTDLMKRAAHLALAIGHEGILIDKTTDVPAGPSRADDKGQPIAVLYTPQDITDWRLERNELVGLKLKESVDNPDILAKDEDNTESCQYLVWSQLEGWIRVDEDGELVTGPNAGFDNPKLDLVPFAVLRPEASAAHPFLGQSLLGNANVFKALFNRCSEEDNVLRDSSWSMLTVSVPNDGDVAAVKEEVGTEVGTTRAIIAKGTIDWKGPNQEVPKSVRDAVQFLVQEIYRMAHANYQRDSRDAESAEALRIKHSELNEMLVGLAGAMMEAELAVARFFFAWMEPTPLLAQAAYDKAKVSITYPREFFVKDLLEELQIWAEAIALDLGLTFTQRTKLRAAKTLDPDMDETTLKKVEDEINAQQPMVVVNAPGADAAALRDRAKSRLSKFVDQGAADNPIVPPADGALPGDTGNK